MQAGPEKRMISMFNEAMELSGRFRKNTYEPAFREFFRTSFLIVSRWSIFSPSM